MSIESVEECLIDPSPSTKNINKIMNWLRGGNPRGFFTEEDTMIIFDGYGNTHDSMKRYLKLRYIYSDFIVQSNGNIAVEGIRTKTALA